MYFFLLLCVCTCTHVHYSTVLLCTVDSTGVQVVQMSCMCTGAHTFIYYVRCFFVSVPGVNGIGYRVHTGTRYFCLLQKGGGGGTHGVKMLGI